MQDKVTLVITSIAGDDHAVLQQYARECRSRHIDFILIGDTKSPDRFAMEGCTFLNIADQEKLKFGLSGILPRAHYARKNLGYLMAIKNGAEVIIETDDDNIPDTGFWKDRARTVDAALIRKAGWVNVYRYFSEEVLWPRGYPLDLIYEQDSITVAPRESAVCPIQQGLADENPDVDAVFRLTHKLPKKFQHKPSVVLSENAWCPFNSQNTTWFKEAFPLLYLPSYCSFRMTDIWRSFVAQKIAWANGWKILFHSPTVIQIRNEHNILKDFEDEIPGYLHNSLLCRKLQELHLRGGRDFIGENMQKCYHVLIHELQLIDKKEEKLLSAWLENF